MKTKVKIVTFFVIIVALLAFLSFIFRTALEEGFFLDYDFSKLVENAIDNVSDSFSGSDNDGNSTYVDGDYLDRETNIIRLRDEMVARHPQIVIRFKDSDNDYIKNGEAIYDDYLKPAMSEEYASGCYSGDYLSNAVSAYQCNIRKTGSKYEITFNITYRDDAAQEQMVDSVIQEVIDSLGLSGMSESDKVHAIYKFITRYVEFDKMAEESSAAGIPDDVAHTAYGALINGQAVCQGFACLFYAMCKNAGIDARIITGTANNGEETGEHAWNMVKVDGNWYYADVTWDTCLKSINWKYYLISGEEMSKDHFAD